MIDAGRIGFVPRGEFDLTETYHMLDFVTFNASTYVAIRTTTGNPVSDRTNWQPLAEVLIATASRTGIVRPDGTTITVDADGTIHGHAAAGVDTFNGRSGSVLPIAGDYDAHQITYLSPTQASTVGDQLDELINGMASGSVSIISGLISHDNTCLSANGVQLAAERTIHFD